MITITSLYAGLIAIFFVWLSLRVIQVRFKERISMGDDNNENLLRRIRAQANCAEYAPLGLILLALLELQDQAPMLLHVLGLMLLLGRLLHAWGLSAETPILRIRQVGMVLTFTMILIASALLIIGSLA